MLTGGTVELTTGLCLVRRWLYVYVPPLFPRKRSQREGLLRRETLFMECCTTWKRREHFCLELLILSSHILDLIVNNVRWNPPHKAEYMRNSIFRTLYHKFFGWWRHGDCDGRRKNCVAERRKICLQISVGNPDRKRQSFISRARVICILLTWLTMLSNGGLL